MECRCLVCVADIAQILLTLRDSAGMVVRGRIAVSLLSVTVDDSDANSTAFSMVSSDGGVVKSVEGFEASDSDEHPEVQWRRVAARDADEAKKRRVSVVTGVVSGSDAPSAPAASQGPCPR